MKKEVSSYSNFGLWSIIDNIDHEILLIRQKELRTYHIANQQLYILGIIQSLGPNATLNRIAEQIDRRVSVVTKHTVVLEKDGLVKRIKDTPKSRRLRIVLTEKGLVMAKISMESKIINAKLSFLTEEERQQLYSTLKRILIKLKERSPAQF